MDQLSSKQLIQILKALKKEKEEKAEEEKHIGEKEAGEEGRLIVLDDEASPAIVNAAGDDEVFEKEIISNTKFSRRQSTLDSFLTRLKPIRKRYTSSFTMHALDHIINGTKVEKVFWIAKLFIVIGTAIFMCRTLFVSYFMKHVDTNLKFVPQAKMKLPLVLICGNNTRTNLDSLHDCRPGSKSYNEAVCKSFQQRCPQFCKEKPEDTECRSDLLKQNVSCDKKLLGQCVKLNGDGKLMQTLNNPGMAYKHKVNDSGFPLWVLVKPPGQVELMPTPGHEMKWTEITQAGNYYFSLEETSVKRLPYPYNKKKPCAKEGMLSESDFNMFPGIYTMDKCLATCWTRADLKHCKTAFTIARIQLEAGKYEDQFLDKPIHEMKECIHSKHEDITKEVEECSLKCPTPCEEEMFSMSVRYEPSDDPAETNTVTMFFYYLEMTKKNIEEAPSYQFSSLFANFGGTLGLMTGMSCISVIEMIIWFVMFIIDRCYRRCHNVQR